MARNVNKISSNIQGAGFLVLGMLIFSLQDVAVKWIGGDYPVLEIVTFRSLIALAPGDRFRRAVRLMLCLTGVRGG